MIVFGRLLLAYLLVKYVFRTRHYLSRKVKPAVAVLISAALFYALAMFFCRERLAHTWAYIGPYTLSGPASVGVAAVFYAVIENFFKFSDRDVEKNILLTGVFIMVNALYMALFFFISPSEYLIDSGRVLLETWTGVLTGLVLCWQFLERFLFYLERDYCVFFKGPMYHLPEGDVALLLRGQRSIFFLTTLIPGHFFWVFVALWAWVSRYAVKEKFLDVTPFSFYAGSAFSLIIGLLIRSKISNVW